MTEPEDAMAVARNYSETLNKGTDEVYDCLAADAVVMRQPAGERTIVGRDAWRAANTAFLSLCPDRRQHIHSMMAVGSWVSTHLTVSGTIQKEGGGLPLGPFSRNYLVIWEVRDGLIASEHIFQQ